MSFVGVQCDLGLYGALGPQFSSRPPVTSISEVAKDAATTRCTLPILTEKVESLNSLKIEYSVGAGNVNPNRRFFTL